MKYTNPTSKWLRGLETLAELARSGNNNTIMIPTELTGLLDQLKGKGLDVKNRKEVNE